MLYQTPPSTRSGATQDTQTSTHLHTHTHTHTHTPFGQRMIDADGERAVEKEFHRIRD